MNVVIFNIILRIELHLNKLYYLLVYEISNILNYIFLRCGKTTDIPKAIWSCRDISIPVEIFHLRWKHPLHFFIPCQPVYSSISWVICHSLLTEICIWNFITLSDNCNNIGLKLSLLPDNIQDKSIKKH